MGKVDYKDISVMIALPCQDIVKARTAFSLVHAVKDLPFKVDMILRMGCDIVGSRVWLAKQAIEYGATHVLYVDSDMFFPPIGPNNESPIKRLVDNDKDIVGAPYNFRSVNTRNTAKPKDENQKVEDMEELFKCSTMGTGFLMIKTEVFKKLPEPWFQFGRGEDGELVYGEDTWFCHLAQEAGYDVWADPKLGVKHIGDYNY